jgi:alpha-galactosidase
MDWLRMDPCTDLMPFWRATDTPGRVGMTEIRYVEGLYQLLDDLMEAHPRLKIDNCGGGGKLIDLEMCKRATPLWRTDFTTPYQETTRDFDMGAVYMQAMIAALDLYTPFHACGGFSELPYHWRSGATTGIGILEDMRGEFYPREVVKAAIRETKRLRKYRTGNYYPPGAITRDPAGWHIFQYHRPGHDDGLVVAFRRHKSKSPEFTRLLMEIDLDGTYEVYRYYDYIFRQHDIMGGRELQLLHLVIEERPGSLVVEYRKVVDAD